MPPLISGGRQTGNLDLLDALPRPGPKPPATKPAPPPTGATSLLLKSPVRSGQSIVFPQGDVTVLGSVASGAEIVAGGSVHVYGALRGRAIGGSVGNAEARIFCLKLEAELIAIDGLYQTADDMDAKFRGRPVQAWLQGEAIMMAELQ
jgi:septum site-determining protein MinC